MKKNRNKRTPAQILGLQKMKLSVKSCRARAKELRVKVKTGKIKGDNAELARRWANWYSSKANQLAS